MVEPPNTLVRLSEAIGPWRKIFDDLKWPFVLLFAAAGMFSWILGQIPIAADQGWAARFLVGIALALAMTLVLSLSALAVSKGWRLFKGETVIQTVIQPLSFNPEGFDRRLELVESRIQEMADLDLSTLKTEIAACKPFAEIARLTVLQEQLDRAISNAEGRKNSFLEAARRPDENMLPDYIQYVSSELVQGIKVTSQIDGTPPDAVAFHQIVLNKFKTPLSDANPHSKFPGSAEIVDEEKRHQVRKVLEYYGRVMSELESAKQELTRRIQKERDRAVPL